MTYAPEHSTLVSMLEAAFERHADRPAAGVRQITGWRWLTYAELRQQIATCRAGLAQRGITRGDRVAIISSNRLEWIVAVYAAHGLGAATVAMYESQLDRDWKHILTDSGAKLCFVGSATIRDRVAVFRDVLPELQIISLDGSSAQPDTFAQLMQQGSQAAPVPVVEPDPADLVYLIYTSGTTGLPKGVQLTHFNIASNVSAMHEVIPFTSEDRSLAFLPWAHVFGGSIELNGMLTLGASLAICESPDKVPEYLGEVQPTVLVAVPRIWNRIYEGVNRQIGDKPALIQKLFHTAMGAESKRKRGRGLGLREQLALAVAKKVIFGKIAKRFGGKLKYAVSGAAALSPEVGEFVDNLGITVYEGYGMTETSGVTTCNAPGANRPGTVGKPLPGIMLKIDGSVAGAGEGEGEIIVYGNSVMAGYNNLADETKAVITEDGGLRTGDMGRLDADGYLIITGRAKEIYKLENGKYVAPAPLEEKITLSPYIAQIMIHGSNKPYNVALVVPDMVSLRPWAERAGIDASGQALLENQRVRQLLQAELDTYSEDFRGFERVRDFVLLAEPFSVGNDMLTPTMKVKRRKVIERHGEKIETLYRAATE